MARLLPIAFGCFLLVTAVAEVDFFGRPVTPGSVPATPTPTKVPGTRNLPASAIAIPADPLEALRAPYVRNITAIRAGRDARAATIDRSYVATLQRLQREATARGDLEGAIQVKAESERVAGGQDPTPTERRMMPAALTASRSRYETEREPIFAAARQQEAEQTRGYLAALDALQKRFTTINQLDKALAAKAERDRVMQESAPAAPNQLEIPIPTGTARLDPALAERIAAAVKSKSYAKTESSDESSAGGHDIPEEGALLVGFEFREGKSEGLPDVQSVRPLFLTREGTVPGKDRGNMEKVTEKVVARNGYAVGGLMVWHNERRIGGIQAVFMKINAASGKLDTSPANSYKSTWFGSRPRGKAKVLGGKGSAIIGVFGKTGADADTIGLYEMP